MGIVSRVCGSQVSVCWCSVLHSLACDPSHCVSGVLPPTALPPLSPHHLSASEVPSKPLQTTSNISQDPFHTLRIRYLLNWWIRSPIDHRVPIDPLWPASRLSQLQTIIRPAACWWCWVKQSLSTLRGHRSSVVSRLPTSQTANLWSSQRLTDSIKGRAHSSDIIRGWRSPVHDWRWLCISCCVTARKLVWKESLSITVLC